MPLIVVPTPIGHLEDITLRALRVLREAHVIACEDTRRTLQLLQRYRIRTPLLSYHEHNERTRAETLLERLRHGETVALVSDAGTPGLSDPGSVLLDAVIRENLPLDVLPGPTAIVPGLLLSGMSPQPFSFFGFLPDGAGERRRVLTTLKSHPWTLVLYLSPHKAEKHLEDMAELFGDRPATLVREISKVHQETIPGTLISLVERARSGLRGELVLVVAGAPEMVLDEGTWQKTAWLRLEAGESPYDIVKDMAERYGIPKNRIKALLFSEEFPHCPH